MNIESINSPIPPEKLVFPSPRFVFFIDGIAVACHETPHVRYSRTQPLVTDISAHRYRRGEQAREQERGARE